MATVLKAGRRRVAPAPFETKEVREAEHRVRAALHRAFTRIRAKAAALARRELSRLGKAAERFGYWTSDGFSEEPPKSGATAEKVKIRKGAEDEERDDHGRWTAGGGGSDAKPETGPFTAAERERGLAALNAAPEAEEGYRHFDEWRVDQKMSDGGPQVALKDVGFAPNPQIFGSPASDRKWREMNVPLADIGRGQSSVMRAGVERKLNGETTGLGNDTIPRVVLSGGKFYVQGGHHRAAAAMIAGRTHIRALVTERVGARKYKKPDAVEKAVGDEDDPEWILAGEIAARLDLAELSFVIDEVGSSMDIVAATAAEATLGAIGVDDQRIVDQIDEAAAAFARERSAELVGMRYDKDGNLVEAARASMRIDESTREMVRETIYAGLVEGKRSTEIADDLESGSAESGYPFSEERAALIANTEIRRAHNEGSLIGMSAARDAGVDVKKEWITSQHDTVCEDCEENEAQGPIDLDEGFASGDDAAPAHPNCNCDVIASVGEQREESGE